jgi:hypothetical protein
MRSRVVHLAPDCSYRVIGRDLEVRVTACYRVTVSADLGVRVTELCYRVKKYVKIREKYVYLL